MVKPTVGSFLTTLAIAGWIQLCCVLPARAAIDKADNSTNLNLGLSWVAGTAPGSGDVAQWSATVTSANATSLGADLSWLGIIITSPGGPVTINSGNTLTLGAAGIDLSAAQQNLSLNCALSLAASQPWPVAKGWMLSIGNNLSGTALLTVAGPGTVIFNGGSGATYALGTTAAGNNALALNGGAVSFQTGTLTLGANGNNSDASHLNGNSTFDQTGGTVNSSFYTRLGSGGTGTISLLAVSGGVFNNTGELLFGFGGSGSGTLTVTNSGTVNAHFLRLGDTSAAGTHTVNLDGGTLKANRIFRNNGTPVFNFNGGLLQVNSSPSSPWFAASVANVWVKNGGAVIDSNGKNITIEPGLKQFAGSTGGLTKLGAGTLTLAGTNTYTGPTVVSNGTLAISGNMSPNTAVSVRDGASLMPGPGTVRMGALTLSPNATLLLALGAATNPANSVLQVNGNLVLDGTVSINDLGGMSTGAVYSVINYTGALTDNGLVMDPHSGWEMTVDTSVANQVRLTGIRKFPFIEVTSGDLIVTSLYTNLTAIVHGTSTNIIWYEVRSKALSGLLADFGAHASSTVWPFTVRHLKAGTNWVTVFARDNSGVTFSNSVRLVLDLPANTPVRPRPIPAEIWWGGLSTNQQLLDPTKLWNFVKQYEDGIFFHSAGYGGLTSSDKTDLATMMRPYNTKFWVELGGGVGTQTPGPGFVNYQGNTGWGAHLTAQQNLGLVMSQITHDYHMEDMKAVCQVNPTWPTNNLTAWWTGDMSITNGSYPYTSGIWRDIFNLYYTNNPHLKVGQTSQPEYWPWDSYPSMLANGLSFTVTNPTTSFSFNARDIIGSFVTMAGTIGHPYFSLQSDAPWNYFGGLGVGTAAQEATMRQKIRVYEQYLQSRDARHTLICNVSNAGSQPGNDDAQDLYYKTNSLNSLFLHQQEGGRANVYLFESWYAVIPHTAAPETKNGSYANLALDAIRYLKGIKDTNGALEGLSLTLSSSGVTNLIQLTNNGDITCLPAVIAIEGAGGGNAVTYLNAANQNINAAILSAEGYVHTNKLTPGQATQIKVVTTGGMDRSITLEAFWNPQDPTGVVRDRLTLSPPNQAPALAVITNRTLIAGQTLIITNVANDPDVPAQTLTFSLINPPSGAMVNSSNGVFTWRPTIAQSPVVTQLKVMVADNGSPSLSATQSFWATINRPLAPTLSAPGMQNSVLSLLVTGDSGPDYTLQATTNLQPPVTWLPLKTNLSPLPPFTFSDSTTNAASKFYRVQIGP